MKAVVFKEPGVIAIENRPMPKIEKPTDVVLKVRMAALCGRYVPPTVSEWPSILDKVADGELSHLR